MPGLERISPPRPPLRAAPPGRMRHPACQVLPRHRHRDAFAAVVLAGAYDEAGDTGRHRVRAGDVIFHRAFESHLDRFAAPGAEVLVIPLADDWTGLQLGHVADPDALARMAERDPDALPAALVQAAAARSPDALDWPDLLAQALRADPGLCLTDWAGRHSLHLGSLSRGFRQVFAATPAAFRAVQRAHGAVEFLLASQAPLIQVAQDCGFADQAHMTRAVARLTDSTPAVLRRRRAARGLSRPGESPAMSAP